MTDEELQAIRAGLDDRYQLAEELKEDAAALLAEVDRLRSATIYLVQECDSDGNSEICGAYLTREEAEARERSVEASRQRDRDDRREADLLLHGRADGSYSSSGHTTIVELTIGRDVPTRVEADLPEQERLTRELRGSIETFQASPRPSAD